MWGGLEEPEQQRQRAQERCPQDLTSCVRMIGGKNRGHGPVTSGKATGNQIAVRECQRGLGWGEVGKVVHRWINVPHGGCGEYTAGGDRRHSDLSDYTEAELLHVIHVIHIIHQHESM